VSWEEIKRKKNGERKKKIEEGEREEVMS